jgi:hypothetical protein
MRTIGTWLALTPFFLGTAMGQDNDGEIRLSLFAHLHIALIERCGHAKGTPYEKAAYEIRDQIEQAIPPASFEDGRRASLFMDLTCSEENAHVRRLLRAAEKFNAASQAGEQRE